MDWLIENADNLGVDPEKIAIGGDSAGGNLATCLCIKRLEESKQTPERQLLLYPGIDTKGDHKSLKTFTDGYFLLTQELLDWFGNNYLTEDDYQNIYASPMQYQHPEKLPPAVVITAGFDPLRDEGHAYAEFLKEAGVKVYYKEYEGLIHGFANFTIEPACYQAMVEIAKEFKQIN
jgi:acetyl esterase